MKIFQTINNFRVTIKESSEKEAENYRIFYVKETNYIVISVIRIAHRKEVY